MKNIYRYAALCLAALSLAGFTSPAPARSAQPWSLQTLHKFDNDLNGNSDGAFPEAGLIADATGALYGTTYEGGDSGYGTVFKLTPPANGQTDWTETVLHIFCQKNFCLDDGAYPMAGLVADPQGNLYGTTSEGGAGDVEAGYGIVFSLTPPAPGQTAWSGGPLHLFTGGSDGAYPRAGLLWRQGALYGTASEGGMGCGDYGCGTVFKLELEGGIFPHFTVLYRFAGGTADGAYPYAGLIADGSGALYGTTYNGGTFGEGTVFKLAPPAPGQTAWTETVLHSFPDPPGGRDGFYPMAGLIWRNGKLYGTTYEGGSSACSDGCGTVFELYPTAATPTGWAETVIYRFPADNGFPKAGLMVDATGALYGTAYEGAGGSAGGTVYGGVFKLTPPAPGQTDWTATVLYTFPDSGTHGAYPRGALISDPQGNLYGTTEEGGYRGGNGACHLDSFAGCGTVFKLTPPPATARDRLR